MNDLEPHFLLKKKIEFSLNWFSELQPHILLLIYNTHIYIYIYIYSKDIVSAHGDLLC
jgi:hypothetical protein